MADFNVRVEGVGEAIKDLESYGKEKAKEVQKEIKKTAINVERKTKKKLVSQLDNSNGRLLSSYHVRHNTDLTSDVYSNLFYAPFVEFGTGKNVFQSNEYTFTQADKDFAKQFIRGPGNNTPAKPALFPALEEERKDFIAAMEKILKKP